MKSRQAMMSPTSMATVRSKMMVRKNVMSSTVTSLLGFFISATNERHPHIPYDTITSTPARQAIGMYLASGMRKRKMSSNTTAWMIPAIGVRPPLLMLVIVRAMAPVAGIPPKRGEARLATPWAISSVLELWWSPITPSATVAESSDSMAPSTAMVSAGGTRLFMVSHVIAGTCMSGMSLLTLKRSPMVSMVVTPK